MSGQIHPNLSVITRSECGYLLKRLQQAGLESYNMILVNYRRIAIIGGGPSGLAAAKSFGVLPTKFDVDLYERNDKVGGVWFYTGQKSNGLDDIDDVNSPEVGNNELISPMYKFLETNISGKLMQYANNSFSADTFVYPTRQEVFEYLQKYRKTIPELVQMHLNTNVLSMAKKNKVWEIQAENLVTHEVAVKQYDAVVLSNGHFEAPYIPDVEGLNYWHTKLPESVTHAKYFDDPEEYANKNVLVIGSSSSGTDIAVQLSVKSSKVFVSNRSGTRGPGLEQLRATFIGLITKYDYDNNRSVTTDQGEIISNIDILLFCTGYRYSFPFLKTYVNDNSVLSIDGNSVRNLYKQMFFIPDPSLVFMTLPKNIVPMPLAESQAAVLSRVYSGNMKLPDKETMTTEYLQEIADRGNDYHSLKFPADADYCRLLQQWIDQCGLSNYGLRAPIWDETKYQERGQSGAMKSERISKVIDYANTLRDRGSSFKLLR